MKSLGVILAGGGSRRMGGHDKALAALHDRRLVDIVFQRISSHTDQVIISGKNDYGLNIPAVPDDVKWPGGPVGGIFSVYQWVRSTGAKIDGLLTIPVDGPRFPEDLGLRLIGSRSAIAAVGDRLHPTFAWWALSDLDHLAPDVASGSLDSLKALAKRAGAVSVYWDDPRIFANINTPSDLEDWNKTDRATP
ncbi:MAG: molybdenum cofactor guanylyltransferase [Pseudomonadota bacterium]